MCITSLSILGAYVLSSSTERALARFCFFAYAFKYLVLIICHFPPRAQERESKFMEIKIFEIHSIVNKELRALDLKANYAVSRRVVEDAERELFAVIDEWKGVCISRIKKVPETFRPYFVVGKNW